MWVSVDAIELYFFFHIEDGIRGARWWRGLGDVYKEKERERGRGRERERGRKGEREREIERERVCVCVCV